ncbi:MAG: FMN-binding negative transcriptional regulator [Deltaproteobacteria bacterium]|nr:FMN-binding negative transcriptional regulator [Deltaproteobacteria bacterium]MBI3293909.1 FMN-binding negative transcriptional regulator [Deltaproteobacteria bacterium]
MRFHRHHEQGDWNEVEGFVRSRESALLVTRGPQGENHFGVINTVFVGGRIVIHIGRTDEQARDLAREARAQLVFHEPLSVIPSYWIDRRYGGAINQFFRYAECECWARVITEGKEMTLLLQRMLDRFQAERSYDPLDSEGEVYREKFLAIECAELEPVAWKTKWNLGQAKPLEAFENVIRELERRAEGPDRATAREMVKWRERHGTPVG